MRDFVPNKAFRFYFFQKIEAKMDSQAFRNIIDQQIRRNYEALFRNPERDEAETGDVLHRFRAAGNLQRVSAREALAGMMAEDVVTLFDMLGDYLKVPMEEWDLRITNLINYLLYLKVIMAEDIMNEARGAVEDPLLGPGSGSTSGFFLRPPAQVQSPPDEAIHTSPDGLTSNSEQQESR